MRHGIRSIPLILATGLACLGALNAEPGSTLPKGIIVLDDCDDQFKGKAKYEDHLTFVSAAGKVGFQVTGINVCESVGCHHVIAVDAPRKCVWVSENVGDCIKRYDFDGKVSVTISVAGCGAIAVHPDTGNVWALVSESGDFTKSRTVVFDPQGRELMSYDACGVDIAYCSKENAFWIVGDSLQKIFATDGFVDLSKRVAVWCGVSVDVDQQSGAVWVAARKHPQVNGSKNELLKFDRDGTQLANIAMGEKNPFQVFVDQRDGSVWVVNFQKSLERFSPEGKHLMGWPVPAVAVLTDRLGAVWAVTKTNIQKLNAKGEALWKIDLAGKTGQAWIGLLE